MPPDKFLFIFFFILLNLHKNNIFFVWCPPLDLQYNYETQIKPCSLRIAKPYIYVQTFIKFYKKDSSTLQILIHMFKHEIFCSCKFLQHLYFEGFLSTDIFTFSSTFQCQGEYYGNLIFIKKWDLFKIQLLLILYKTLGWEVTTTRLGTENN